jgi:hypothetical protein
MGHAVPCGSMQFNATSAVHMCSTSRTCSSRWRLLSCVHAAAGPPAVALLAWRAARVCHWRVLQQVAHQAAGKLQDVLQRHLHLVRACTGSKTGLVGQ